MTPIKTYTTTIKVTFEAHEKENPRSIVKHMADYHNGMRGANLHTYSTVETLIEETDKRDYKKNSRR